MKLHCQRHWHALLVPIIVLYGWNTAIAQTTVTVTGAGNLPICMKQAEPYQDGSRLGSLKRGVTARPLYSGPSVLCPQVRRLTSKQDFVVTGQQWSSFGKPWLLIELENQSQQTGWIPAKYVEVGSSINTSTPVVTKPIKDRGVAIDPIDVSPTIDLNVRACPETSCEQITSVSADSTYLASRRASNGWLYVEAAANQHGWISGKYTTEIPTIAPTVTEPEIKPEPVPVEVVTPEAPILVAAPPDPCTASHQYFKRQRPALWQLTKPIFVRSAPLADCFDTEAISVGRGVASLYASGDYHQISYLVDGELKTGWLEKEKETDTIAYREFLSHKLTHEQITSLLKNREQYWGSFRHHFHRSKQAVTKYFNTHPVQLGMVIAFLIGSILLLIRRTRLLTLRTDQVLLRSGYFLMRSRRFWLFLRKLVFVLVCIGGCMALAFAHGAWLANFASTEEKALGGVSILLLTLSLGWFGLRVIAFITGMLLLTYSYIQFFIDVLLVIAAFLLPGLLLLALYYLRYRSTDTAHLAAPPPFNSIEIERIHRRMFRLRYFYPETIVTWLRGGNFSKHVKDGKKVVWAYSQQLNNFFNYVFRGRANPA